MRFHRHLVLLLLPLGVLRAEPLTAEQMSFLRTEIRSNFLIPDPLPALDSRTHRTFEPAEGVTAEAVSYATEAGTRVPAILYLPKPLPPGGRIPGLVVVCGHGGDKYAWYSYYTGILYARAGAAVLTYDLVGEGERNIGRKSWPRAHDQIQGGEEIGRRLCGLMLTDIMQAVSYLASRPEVDPARLGALGHSMGSFDAALAGAIDPRLRVCVMTGGGNLDGPGGVWDRTDKPLCESLPYRSLTFLGDRAGILYALRAAAGPALIWNGRLDSCVSKPAMQGPYFEELRARVAKLRGTRANVFDYGFTPNAGHRPYFVTRPVVAWLEKQLRFPNWTDASVQAMSETRIGDWGQRYHITFDPLYATEKRDSGTLALGADIPGFQHDDLNVFTPAEWERVKGSYVMETWVATAAAQSTIGRKVW